MFAFLKRLFPKSQDTQRQAFELAQKEWQATEGAKYQMHVAAMLIDFVRNGISTYLDNHPDSGIVEAEAEMARIVAYRTYHWRRVNLTRCPAVRSEEFHVRAELDLVMIGLLGTRRVVIKESGSFMRLAQGQAMVEIHHLNAPRYRMRVSDWKRHGETCAIYAAELKRPPVRQKEIE